MNMPPNKPKRGGLVERLSKTRVPPTVAFIDLIGSLSAVALFILYLSNGGHLG